MSVSVDDQVGLDVRGFGMGFNKKLLGVDVKSNSLEVVDNGFGGEVGLLFLHRVYCWDSYCL